ncbi:MAG: hypothetical protein HKP59_08235 [Lutibacter sp.]|uniref:hypothetical protein n=1 Tax=Lutibacter sp. TaxID=1925666 RepID=UPI0017B21596|nr:hypothetical protein [Lutibacter sp.]MBT8317601.1 hypothetical protein [Lutibacter sp.]NNJ58460.1 hypothetical protein [Lutibacter sp.]
MDTLQLKKKIIERIIEIEDNIVLKNIDNLLNSSDEDMMKLLNFPTNKLQNQDGNETEDFTGYIKEWVKNM